MTGNLSGVFNQLFTKPFNYLFGGSTTTSTTRIPNAPLTGGDMPTANGKNAPIRAPGSERSRSDALNAWGGGPESIALDPLGRRGTGGYGRTTLLGR